MNESMSSTEPQAYGRPVFELPSLDNTSSLEINESIKLLPSLNLDDASTCESAKIAEIREENLKLKQLAQYLTTYNNSLKSLIEHEYSSPSAKRALLAKLVEEYGLSRRHVCRLLNLARSTCWYRSTAKSARSGNLKVVQAIQDSTLFEEEAI